MARPRIFVSSTYYDLKHIRSSLELFVDSLGYDPVLSEKGDIAYTSDETLDASCYREAAAADIFVLVIGGRYGSEVSGDRKRPSRTFFEKYDSITKKEFETAYTSDIPIYILIESGVYAEYYTYLKNKDNKSIVYAHADSVNVFVLIEEILSKPRNNPVFQFERASDIEGWLREQWAGLFKELINKRNQQQQLSALSQQIGELTTVSDTLKTYMEAVLTGTNPQESSKIIAEEDRKIHEAKLKAELRENYWFKYMKNALALADEAAESIIRESTSFEDACEKIASLESKSGEDSISVANLLRRASGPQRDFNKARVILGLPEFEGTARSHRLLDRPTEVNQDEPGGEPEPVRKSRSKPKPKA